MSGTFVQAAVILLREGLEALLVVAALAAYLSKLGAAHRLNALYAGAGVAVLASLAAAWVFQTYYGGGHNDLLEGVVMLGAAALMLYVSVWLFLRRDPQVWQRQLRDSADTALSRQSGLAIAGLSFLAVFREGAETVLFIHALASGAGGYGFEIFAGLAAAAVALTILFVVIRTAAMRLPLRPVFTITSVLLFVMAIKFIGQALTEFQEQQFVTFTPIDGGAWLETIGLNPTWEAINLQGIVVLATVAVAALLSRVSRPVPSHG